MASSSIMCHLGMCQAAVHGEEGRAGAKAVAHAMSAGDLHVIAYSKQLQ